MKNKRKILFVASEATPYIATGGLAEVVGSLSKALSERGDYDVRVILPLYSDMKQELRDKLTFVKDVTVPVAWRNQYCGIFRGESNGVVYYFIDNEYYFKRKGLYGHYDDGERFAFFCRGVLEALPVIDFFPDVLHCHDWQAALAAIYLKTIYCQKDKYRDIKTVFTVHNIEYQGKFSLDNLQWLFGIDAYYQGLTEYNGCINLMKGAIECCDRFSTVSPTYAEEIKDPYFSHGLDAIVRRNESKLCGILNGIDTEYYDPATDKAIFALYDKNKLANKAVCKEQLQRMLNLQVRPNTPVVAMITRLVSHKGLDLVTAVINEALENDMQFVILGTGEGYYEHYFAELAARHSQRVAAVIAFNPELSRQIYSGADIFLMPSQSEPCGLAQMIASRYGTVAIVRETGGLKDSIKPYGAGGNGFTFANYNAHDMLYVLKQALELYRDKTAWRELVRKAMSADFSWKVSANGYDAMYKALTEA